MIREITGILALATLSSAHGSQLPLAGPHKDFWYNTLPGDGGTQVRILNSTTEIGINA